MMVFVNHFTAFEKTPKVAMKVFAQLLAPFSPHVAEEMWQAVHSLGNSSTVPSLSYSEWPAFDPERVKASSVTVAIQVLGKLRGTLEVEPGTGQAVLEQQAKALESVSRFLEGKEIVKVVYVQNKILNFVVK
jgi:leucyl-tRNA synthetase